MIPFQYKALDQTGKIFQGILESTNENEALQALREKNLIVVELKARSIKKRKLKLQKNTSLSEIARFNRLLVFLLKAGVPMVTSLATIEAQMKTSALKTAIANAKEMVKEGHSFYASLAKNPDVFDPMMINMVQAGELGGVLPQVLEYTAQHYEKEHDVTENIKGAMIYPFFVLLLSLGAVIVLLTFVFPMFIDYFTNFGEELPYVTRVVILGSQFLQDSWFFVFLLIGGAAVWVVQYMETAQGRAKWDTFVIKLPVVGKLLCKIIIARIFRTLGMLLMAGVSVIQALEASKKIAQNTVFIAMLEKCRADVLDGKNISTSLYACKVLPSFVPQMVKVGEETGTLPDLMLQIADFHQKEADRDMKVLSQLVEPMLIISIGGVVGFIVFSMILPLFSVLTYF